MDSAFYFAAAIAIVAIAFFFIFRQPIISLIGRIRSISKTGITTDPAQQKAGTAERDPRAEAEAMMRELDNALIREVEEHIKNQLRERNLLGAEGVPVLTRYLASAYTVLSFEQNYRVIWGSQLSLLTYLNAEGDGQPAEAIRSFYTLAAVQYPDAYINYSFESWLGFLKDQLLLREDAGRLRVTIRGREFLAHLTRAGLSHNKAG